MKNKKGISIVVLILVLVVVGVITTVGIVLITNKPESQLEGNVGEQQDTTANTDSEIEENINNVKAEETKQSGFWVDNWSTWGEQKEKFTLTLFNGKFTAPIDLKSADKFVKQYHSSAGDDYKSITEKATQTYKVWATSDGLEIWAYYGQLNKNNSYEDRFIIKVKNFNDEKTPLSECLKNNWWYIQETVKSPADTLGIDMSDIEEYNDKAYNGHHGLQNEIPLLEKVVNELGGPKHIYVTERLTNDYYQTIEYLLSYEYEEFSVILEVQEYNDGSTQQCGIDSITYYTNVTRDKMIEEKKEYYEYQYQHNPNTEVRFEIMK